MNLISDITNSHIMLHPIMSGGRKKMHSFQQPITIQTGDKSSFLVFCAQCLENWVFICSKEIIGKGYLQTKS